MSVRKVERAVYREGRGMPLLLLHGIGMTWRAWEPVLPRLTLDHDVVAPTLPGHAGGPPAPSGQVTIASLADRLCGQLDELGLGVVDVAGNSLGGWLALELARRGRARSVVAISPAGAWTAPRDMRRLAVSLRVGMAFAGWAVARRVLDRPRGRRLALRRMVRYPEQMDPAQAKRVFDDMTECTVVGELVERAVHSGPIVPFPVLPCPVTLAWGEHDKVIPFARYGRPMLRALPGARMVTLADVGHVPMSDAPGVVAQAVLEGCRANLTKD